MIFKQEHLPNTCSLLCCATTSHFWGVQFEAVLHVRGTLNEGGRLWALLQPVQAASLPLRVFVRVLESWMRNPGSPGTGNILAGVGGSYKQRDI